VIASDFAHAVVFRLPKEKTRDTGLKSITKVSTLPFRQSGPQVTMTAGHRSVSGGDVAKRRVEIPASNQRVD